MHTLQAGAASPSCVCFAIKHQEAELQCGTICHNGRHCIYTPCYQQKLIAFSFEDFRFEEAGNLADVMIVHRSELGESYADAQREPHPVKVCKVYACGRLCFVVPAAALAAAEAAVLAAAAAAAALPAHSQHVSAHCAYHVTNIRSQCFRCSALSGVHLMHVSVDHRASLKVMHGLHAHCRLENCAGLHLLTCLFGTRAVFNKASCSQVL